jgi:hypothetical protein
MKTSTYPFRRQRPSWRLREERQRNQPESVFAKISGGERLFSKRGIKFVFRDVTIILLTIGILAGLGILACLFMMKFGR